MKTSTKARRQKYVIALLVAGATLASSVNAQVFSNVWENAVANDNLTRGMAFNALSNQVVVATRTGGNKALLYNGDTGVAEGQLNLTGVSGGATFTWNAIASAEDGAVYGFNVSSTTFKIYRWPNTDTNVAPYVSYGPGDPAQGLTLPGARWGDNVAIRGSGVNTEILAGSFANTNVALFKTTDGTNFTAIRIDIQGIANNDVRDGLAFYTNNTFWAKRINRPLILVRYDMLTSTTAVGTVLYTSANSDLGPIGCNPSANLLAGISAATPAVLRLYDISTLPPTLKASTNFLTSVSNGNGTGAAAISGTNRVFALWSNNGVKAAKVVEAINTPTIDSQPASISIYTNFPGVTFSVAASGGQLKYQWRRGDEDIPGATTASYTKSGPFTLADSGSYTVVVTNSAGSITSSPPAVLGIWEPTFTDVLNPLWSITNGTRSYLQADNNSRGLAYDPANNKVVVVSRTGGTGLYVLDAATGADFGTLDATACAGGSFALNMIGVTDDGGVFAGNMRQTDADGGYKLYFWPSTTHVGLPSLAYDANPDSGSNLRWGDSIAVRGAAAASYQVLIGSSSNRVALFKDFDGTAFPTPVVFTTNPADGIPNGFAQWGIAFGAGNTFWAKSSGFQLRQFEFDPTGANTTLTLLNAQASPSRSVAAVGVAAGPNNTLATVHVSNPDNLQIYRIASGSTNAPMLLDQEFFPTDNPNGNSTGSAAFGAGALFALDSNNGIMAVSVNTAATLPALQITAISYSPSQASVTWQSLPGGTYELLYKDSLTDPTWQPVASVVANANLTTLSDTTPNAGSRFYLVAQRAQ